MRTPPGAAPRAWATADRTLDVVPETSPLNTPFGASLRSRSSLFVQYAEALKVGTHGA